jgi:hypothetical protein
MEKQTDGHRDGWRNRQMDIGMDGETDRWTEGWMEKQTDGHRDRWTNRQTEEWTDREKKLRLYFKVLGLDKSD